MLTVMKRLTITLALLAAAAVCSFAQSRFLPMRDTQEAASIPFSAGEKIIYKVHYKWGAINTDVATGTLTVDDASVSGQSAYKCRLYGKTARFYDNFFKVREDFTAWISTDGLIPVKYTRKVKEGSYYADDEYFYDHSAKLIKAVLKDKKKGTRELDLPLEEGVSDFMTEMFRIRNMDFDKLEEGATYDYSLANGSKVSPLLITYKGRTVKKLKDLGKVASHRFVIRLSGTEQFSEGSEMNVWISDDDNRLIVAMETPIRVGNVVARMSKYEGLSHPFTLLED